MNPFRDPIGFGVGLLEIISEISKIISFSFRLYGNIFAGEVLLAVMVAYAVFAPLPFYGLELFVGLVQGLVFSLLTIVFSRWAPPVTVITKKGILPDRNMPLPSS